MKLMDDLSAKEVRVLRSIGRAEMGLTVDEFVVNNNLYVNSWAPVFTRLFQRGFTQLAGQRETVRGTLANVHFRTQEGRDALDAVTRRMRTAA